MASIKKEIQFAAGLVRQVPDVQAQRNPCTRVRPKRRNGEQDNDETRRETTGVQPCGVTRASLVRARAARALSEAAESRCAVAHVPGVRVYCTGYGAVRGASVSSCVLLCCFCGWGAAEVSRGRTVASQTLRGGPHAVAAPATWTDLLGARAERVPDCSSYLSRIPWSATDSGSSVHPRNSVYRPAVSPSQPPRGRLHALLNASAAGESTS